MATLLLTAAGTALGGPLGGALGALAGQAIDGTILGRPSGEGPRLKDLTLTTSTYGNPVPKHFGRMRVGGTVIWATDLKEVSDVAGGGKGQPKVTTYSYSASFAVALSSRPMSRLGRIWADGSLLRGAAGDLKTGGSLRFYDGCGDHEPDPLLRDAEGSRSPAYRGTAYVVFEDLQLADFGNRIPSLTFEIIADDEPMTVAQLLNTLPDGGRSDLVLRDIGGFSIEGGPLVHPLAAIHALHPIACDSGGDTLTLSAAEEQNAMPILLGQPTAGWDDETSAGDGTHRQRDPAGQGSPGAMRYYDLDRDYQPNLQRAGGRAIVSSKRSIEFPGALSAGAARSLVDMAMRRAAWQQERMLWRVAELDPAIAPGSMVMAPGVDGFWTVEEWEWSEKGIELQLVRLRPVTAVTLPGDAGRVQIAADVSAGALWLRAFELPWDGIGAADIRRAYVATGSKGGSFAGAALYLSQEGRLVPAGVSGRRPNIGGTISSPLMPSSAMLFDRSAILAVTLESDDAILPPASLAALAQGANRIWIDGEIVQYGNAVRTAPRSWTLSGLLRGRGGTERRSAHRHAPGSAFVVIDDRLTLLDADLTTGSAGVTVTAISPAERSEASVHLSDAGASLRPLPPVHPRASLSASGGLDLRWTRRARGAWAWPDEVDAPLVEQTESYRLGIGPRDQPHRNWVISAPSFRFPAEELAALRIIYPSEQLWVRQIGTFAQSDPLFLFSFSQLEDT